MPPLDDRRPSACVGFALVGPAAGGAVLSEGNAAEGGWRVTAPLDA